MQLVGTRCNTLARLKDMIKLTKAIELDLMLSRSSGTLMIGHPIEQQQFLRMSELMTLQDVLRTALEEDLTVFLDLKKDGISEFVAKELLKFAVVQRDWLKEKIVVIARSQENLVAMAEANLGIQTGWIFEGALVDPVGDAKRLGCNYFLGRSYDWTDKFLAKVRAKADLKPCACLVSTIDEVMVCGELGIKYVFVRASIEEMKEIQAHLAVCL